MKDINDGSPLCPEGTASAPASQFTTME